MLYAVAFIAGGYLIPFTAHFIGIWKAEQRAVDSPTLAEKFMTALIGAATWPLQDGRYEGQD